MQCVFLNSVVKKFTDFRQKAKTLGQSQSFTDSKIGITEFYNRQTKLQNVSQNCLKF